LGKLIDDKQYFVVPAPRYSGETKTLVSLAKQITSEGKHTALKFSCERGQPFSDNISKVEKAIIRVIQRASQNVITLNLQCPL
jgi:hypothetical protein